VNQETLALHLADRLGGDLRVAATAVNGLVEVIREELASGGRVMISRFGLFEVQVRAPRTGRNPHTREAVPIRETVVPVFRPAPYFKDLVAEGRTNERKV
jgi:DNA-binding protein HU-beta